MAGNNSLRGDQTVTFTDNLSFDGTERNGMDTNGQLWIGATASDRANNGGHVRKGVLTSPDASLTIGYSAPNITLSVTSGGPIVQTLSDDVNTIVTPSANNIQLVGHVVEQGATKFSTVVAGTHLLNLNPMSSSRWIVDPLGFNGTHTTIATALTSATSGDTIFLLPGTYTENLTLKAGVNISAYQCDSHTPNVTIVGKCTFTRAGTVTLSGIRLQTNGDYCVEVTGTDASILTLVNCYVNAVAASNAIHHTSSSASSMVILLNCKYNVGTNTMAISTSAGQVVLEYCEFDGTTTTTASTFSAGTFQGRYSELSFPVTTTSAGGVVIKYCTMQLTNTTNINHGGSGAFSLLENSAFDSGTAVCITVGTGSTLGVFDSEVKSSNTNPISGLGTLNYVGVSLSSTGVVINTTTISAKVMRPGISLSGQQPCFQVNLSGTTAALTGDNTTATVTFATTVFDQNTNFSSTTFTAPYTGRYLLMAQVLLGSLAAGHTAGFIQIVTTSRTYVASFDPILLAGIGTQATVMVQAICDMAVTNTAIVQINVSGGAKAVTAVKGGATDPRTWFCGHLLC